MSEAKCTSCGKMCTVPFKPSPGKPVYCRECFSTHRNGPAETAAKSSVFDGKIAWARRRDGGARREEEQADGIRKFNHPA